MLRNLSQSMFAVLILSLPSALLAGGPPMLCLPIDGVTSENAEACTELLISKLQTKVWKHSNRPQAVTLVRRHDQWYLTFYMDDEVRLSEVQAALKGSSFSVPKGKLRLFGHAILDIDARSASQQALLTDLKAIPYVAIEESKATKNLFVVTLDMPYPVETNRSDRESIAWEKFQRNGLSSVQASRSETLATPATLPSYTALRDVVARHDTRLTDIRWSNNYACRALGAVGYTSPDKKSQQAGSTVP